MSARNFLILFLIVALVSLFCAGAFAAEGDIVWSQAASSAYGYPEMRGVQSMVIDENYMYVLGTPSYVASSSSLIMEKRNLSDGSIVWSNSINPFFQPIASVSPRGITVQGPYIYVNTVDLITTSIRIGSALYASAQYWNILKYDKLTGSLMWRKTYSPSYGDPAIPHEVGIDIAIEQSGTYVFSVGQELLYRNGTSVGSQIKIEKLTNAGDQVWEKVYHPSASSNGRDYVTSVAVDSNGLYLGEASCTSICNYQIEKRAQSDGSIVWTQSITHPVVTDYPANAWHEVRKILPQGAFVYVATEESVTYLNHEWRIEKRNSSDGSLVWSKTFDHNIKGYYSSDSPQGLATFGNYLYVTGTGGDARYLITKIDQATGNEIWTISENVPATSMTGFFADFNKKFFYLAGTETNNAVIHNRFEKRRFIDDLNALCPDLNISAGALDPTPVTDSPPLSSGFITKSNRTGLYYADLVIKNNTIFPFQGASNAVIVMRRPLGAAQFLGAPVGQDVNRSWIYYDAWLCDGNTIGTVNPIQKIIDNSDNGYFVTPKSGSNSCVFYPSANTQTILDNNIVVTTNTSALLPKTNFSGYITQNGIQYPIIIANIPPLDSGQQFVIENIQWLKYDSGTPNPSVDFNFQLDCTNSLSTNLPPVVSNTTRDANYNASKKSEFIPKFAFDELPNDLKYEIAYKTPNFLDCNINGKYIDYAPAKNVSGTYSCKIRATDKYGLSSEGDFTVNTLPPNLTPVCTISAQKNPQNPNSDFNFTINTADFTSLLYPSDINAYCTGALNPIPSITQPLANSFQAICPNYQTSGLFKVKITKLGKTADCNLFAEVNPVAEAGPNVNLYAGGSSNLAGSASGGNGTYQYFWKIKSVINNNCTISDSNKPTAVISCQRTTTFNSVENAVVELSVTSAGTTVSDTTTATIYPTLVVGTGLEQTINPKTTGSLNASATGGSAPYYATWSFPYLTDGSCQIPNPQRPNTSFFCTTTGIKTARITVIDSGPIVQTASAEVNVYVTDGTCSSPKAVCLSSCPSGFSLDSVSPSCTMSGAAAQCCVSNYSDLNLASLIEFSAEFDLNQKITFSYKCNKFTSGLILKVNPNKSPYWTRYNLDCSTAPNWTAIDDNSIPKNEIIEATLSIPSSTTPCDVCTRTIYVGTKTLSENTSIPDNSTALIIFIFCAAAAIIFSSGKTNSKK